MTPEELQTMLGDMLALPGYLSDAATVGDLAYGREEAPRLYPRHAPTIAAELIAARKALEEWKASQHYSYIGADGKTVKARDLDDELIAARAKLAAAEGLAEALEIAKHELRHHDPEQPYVKAIRAALAAWEAAK